MVNTWKIVLAALAIFAAGVITGGVTVGMAGRMARTNQTGGGRANWNRGTNGFPAWAGAGPGGTNQPLRGPGSMRIGQIHNALQLMTLSPAQKERTDFLAHETEQILRDSWEAVAPKMQREVRMLENRIADGLPPEQRQVFRDLMKKRPIELREAVALQATNTAAVTAPPGTNSAPPATNSAPAPK